MICQICTVKSQTARLPKLTKALVPARSVVTQLKSIEESGQFWSPITAGPYLVPVSRWIE